MAWTDIYKSLAVYLNNVEEYPPGAVEYIYSCVSLLVDLNQEYSDAITTLLGPMYDLYRKAVYTRYISEDLKIMIDKINEFTEKNYGDLAIFINSIAWDGGCVPYYWGTYSTDLNYDTSEWNICS